MLLTTSIHRFANARAIALNVFAMLFVFSAFSVSAAEDKFSFDTPAQRESFLKLTAELRCPMCQNQNIADSDAMIAHDMSFSLWRRGGRGGELCFFRGARVLCFSPGTA